MRAKRMDNMQLLIHIYRIKFELIKNFIGCYCSKKMEYDFSYYILGLWMRHNMNRA